MSPLIVTAAITGGGAPRARSCYQPVTPSELVTEALTCWRAGASIIHIHTRGEDGETTTDVGLSRKLCSAIRDQGCDAVLSLSAGDDGGKASHAQRLALAESGAEMVTLAAGSFNLGNRLYDNKPEYLREMSGRTRDLGVRPEIEVFDSGHVATVAAFQDEGLLVPPHFVQLLTGPRGTLPTDSRLLALLVERLPPDSQWSVSAQTGDDHALHARLLLWAFTNGGHVRTGMEDMVWLRPGVLAQSNGQLVEQWVKTAELWGRPIASPEDARRLLGLATVAGAAPTPNPRKRTEKANGPVA
jgi:3-keto-5-aminohexanoate cleavage enzyme